MTPTILMAGAAETISFYPMTLKATDQLDIPIADKEKIYYKNAQSLGF